MTFDKLTTVTASTKRPPALSGGKRGSPQTKISSLKITPLATLDASTRQRLAIDSPVELLQTFCEGTYDIRKGDDLVIGSAVYPIKFHEEWPYFNLLRHRIIVEKVGAPIS